MTVSAGDGNAQQNSLFTDASLGMDDYDMVVKTKKNRLQISKEEFWRRMENYFEKENNLYVYADDLKTAVALAETPNDFQRVIDLCYRYQQQSEKLRLFAFNFGPLVMRMFHRRQQPMLAYEMIKKETLVRFFDRITSYQICMDLLYECQKYDLVMDVWECYKKSEAAATYPHPRSLQVLYCGACYKLNTENSYRAGLQFISDCVASNSPLVRKATTFVSALCLRQNKPQMALELLDYQTNNDDFTTSCTLKCMTLTRLDRLKEAVDMIEMLVTTDDLPASSTHIHKMSVEAVEEVARALQKDGVDPELRERFLKVRSFLKLGTHLVGLTVDQLVCYRVMQLRSRRSNMQLVEDGIFTQSREAREAPTSFLPSQGQAAEKVSESQRQLNELRRASSRALAREAPRKTWVSERITHAVADRIRKEGPFED